MSAASLAGRTILITRSPRQSGDFRELLEARGARVVELATIEIRPRPSAEIDPAAGQVLDWDWLIFTSANAVRIFLDRCQATGTLSPLKTAPKPLICAVGPATRSALEEIGLEVNLMPENFRAEGVLAAFQERLGDLSSLRFLLPVASKARAVLPDGLQAMGAELTVLPVYDTVPPEDAAEQLQQLLSRVRPDLVAVTSSSTARNFVALCPPEIDPQSFAFASIGPITGKTCRELGLNVALEATVSTIPGLVEAISEYFA